MAAGDQEKIDFKAWMGVWGTMLGAFMAVLDIQITNAFPSRDYWRHRGDSR
jgi:DHA2 family multidrug resistance protein